MNSGNPRGRLIRRECWGIVYCNRNRQYKRISYGSDFFQLRDCYDWQMRFRPSELGNSGLLMLLGSRTEGLGFRV